LQKNYRKGVVSLNDIEFWTVFENKRKDYQLSNERIAIFANMSRMQLSRLKKGEAVLTDEYKERLNLTLEKLNPHNPLEMMFDYCRVRFQTSNVKYIIEKVVQMKMIGWINEKWAFNGYDEHYEYGEIMIS
jgi:phage replication initiation protein